MAKKVLKLDSILQLQRLAADPVTGLEAGQLYYNTTDNKVKQYNGTSWQEVSGGLVGQPLNDGYIIVGDPSNLSIDLDTNLTGDIKIDATNGAVIKPGVIENADINASAQIEFTKMEVLTANRAVQTSASGYIEESVTTSTELGYLSGVTSAVQTQLNDKLDLTGGTMTGEINMGGNKITNVGMPTQATDVATKGYADAIKQGLDIKDSVRAATVGNIVLSGTQVVDGVTLVAGDRVLVKNQTTASENGIYVVAAGSWARSADADTDPKVTPGMFTFVEEGTTQEDTGWVLTTNGTIVVGTTALSFTQFSGTGSIVAGLGLTKSGNTLDVNVDNTSIEIVSDALQIKDGGVTNAKVAPGIAATKIGAGTVDNTEFGYLDGVTSPIQPQINAKLSNVVEDTTPQLGGDLDTNGYAFNQVKLGTSTQFSFEQYVHGITLSTGVSNQVITQLLINKLQYDTVLIDYKLKEATTNRARVGRLMVTTDGTNVSLTDTFTDTDPIAITFDAQISGNDLQITYSSAGSQVVTMRAKATLFLV